MNFFIIIIWHHYITFTNYENNCLHGLYRVVKCKNNQYYNNYFEKVINGTEYSFKESMIKFENHLNKNNLKIADIKCKGCS